MSGLEGSGSSQPFHVSCPFAQTSCSPSCSLLGAALWGSGPVSSSFPTCPPVTFLPPSLPGAPPPLRGLWLGLLSPQPADSPSFPPRAAILGDAQPDWRVVSRVLRPV